ncbi:MAG: response regulator transcription factor [Christensenellaceae bacterium]
MKIIVVEDNPKIRQELSLLLNRYGYEVKQISEFENIVDEILKQSADLLLLDINLPLYDGYYICREIRKKSDLPIIIVTSRDTEMDELMSMNLGADDFITKPYNTQILLARIATVLKRSKPTAQCDRVCCGNFTINFSHGVIELADTEIELTKNELKILNCLTERQGKIVPREELMNYLWNSDLFVDENTLSVNINRLRKKLEAAGITDLISTKRGMGYIIA